MQPMFLTTPGAGNPGNPILLEPEKLGIQLSAPFHPDHVEWRPGNVKVEQKRALSLAYINARAARRRLNKVCGIGGWQTVHYPIGAAQVGCAIAIWVNGQWVTKTDGAFVGLLEPRGGSGNGKVDAKEEGRLDKDAKGSLSAAFKRACASWGIGEYLYDMASPWEDVTVNDRGYVGGFTEEAQRRLDKLAGEFWFRHHDAEIGKHERAAAKSFADGNLTEANDAARAACRLRDQIFGADHTTSKRALAFLAQVAEKMGAKNGAPPASAAASGSGAASTAIGTEPGPDLYLVIQRMDAAENGDAVLALARPVFKAHPAESADGKALRNALEKNMQRFTPGWTLEAAEKAAREAKAKTDNGKTGGAPAAATPPPGASGKAPPKGARVRSAPKGTRAPASAAG